MIRSRENRTNGYNPLPAQLFQAKDYEGGFLTASTLQYLSLKRLLSWEPGMVWQSMPRISKLMRLKKSYDLGKIGSLQVLFLLVGTPTVNFKRKGKNTTLFKDC